MGNKLCEAQGNCGCQEEHGIETGLMFTSLGWGTYLDGLQANIEDQSHWNFVTAKIVGA